MKTNPFLETVPRLVFDERAYSVKELREWSGLGTSSVGRMVKEKMASGEWEEVFKHSSDGKPKRAWRLKRKRK